MREPISPCNTASEKNGKTNAAVTPHWVPKPEMRLPGALEGTGDSVQVGTARGQSTLPAELPALGLPGPGTPSRRGPCGSCRNNYAAEK